MLGTVRRYGVVHALRASVVPRSLYARSTPQLLRWQAPSSSAFPQIIRSLHNSPLVFSSASAEAQKQPNDLEPLQRERLSEFAHLADKGLVDPRIVRTIIKDMNIKTMTDVQSQTIYETLEGDDVLAQAKTGTGKTLAFLLPVLQNIMNDPSIQRAAPPRRYSRRSNATSADIRAIIISPTRELAEQIATEAQRLASNTNVVVQTAVGGTRKREGLLRIQNEGCHLLIGTPGRLKDILSDSSSGVKAPNLSTLVFDEADRLLDAGFMDEIMDIQRLLPDPMKVDRQTLMFSATVPHDVKAMVRQTMKPDFKFIKTIREDEVPTHLTVPQKYVLLNGYENSLPAFLEFVKKYLAAGQENPDQRPFKAIAYFNSTVHVNLAFEAFQNLLNEAGNMRSGHPLRGVRLLEMHSQLTQAKRTRTSDNFKNSRSGILFSSDVTARGMDFPNVTHVFQFGVPRDRETYIHRLGRTARANKTGEGWIFLHGGEFAKFKEKMRKIPVQEDATLLETAAVDMTSATPNASPAATEIIAQVNGAIADIPEQLKRDAYKSQMGPLNGIFDRKKDMVRAMNDLAVHGYGLSEPPQLSHTAARNMGIDRVPGLNISGGGGGGYGRRSFRSDDDNRRGYDSPRRSSYSRSSDSRSSYSRSPSTRSSQFGQRGGYRNRSDETRNLDSLIGVGRSRGEEY